MQDLRTTSQLRKEKREKHTSMTSTIFSKMSELISPDKRKTEGNGGDGFIILPRVNFLEVESRDPRDVEVKNSNQESSEMILHRKP